MKAAGKVVKAIVRMRLPAGKAAPSPVIGQAIGALGLNMMEFCKKFNAASEKYQTDLPMRCRVTAYDDRSFDVLVKLPPSTYFLKKAAKLEKGGSLPGRETAGTVSIRQIYEIAKLKIQDVDPESQTLDGLCRSLQGTCKTMGLRVIP